MLVSGSFLFSLFFNHGGALLSAFSSSCKSYTGFVSSFFFLLLPLRGYGLAAAQKYHYVMEKSDGKETLFILSGIREKLLCGHIAFLSF